MEPLQGKLDKHGRENAQTPTGWKADYKDLTPKTVAPKEEAVDAEAVSVNGAGEVTKAAKEEEEEAPESGKKKKDKKEKKVSWVPSTTRIVSGVFWVLATGISPGWIELTCTAGLSAVVRQSL